MLAAVAALAAAGAGPHGPPITSFLKLGSGSCAAFTLEKDGALRLQQRQGGSAVVDECLTYGGYSEANTGIAKCEGWSAPSIGGQLWAVSGAGNATRLSVVGCGSKELGVFDCGDDKALPLEVCSSGGGDCGAKGGGCAGAFEWTLRKAGSGGAVELVSTLPGKARGLCAVVGGGRPPAPAPTRPVGPLPGGGGPWSTVCNATAACPVEQTCCRTNSTNWGCCPGPDAVCCPGGVICCPHGFVCQANPQATGTEYAHYCKAAGASLAATASAPLPTPRKLVNWPPEAPVTPAPRMHQVEHRWPRKGAAELRASSADGTASVTVDATSGDLTAVTVGAQSFPTRGLSTILPLLANHSSGWSISVTHQVGGAVRVVRTLRSYVSVAEEFSPDPSAPSAIAWSLNVTGLASTPFTLPVSTSFAFDKQTAAEVQWWAAWDRGSYGGADPGPWTDPLSPSDGGAGFWSGSYNYVT